MSNDAISHIVFGWHLDGPTYPETPTGNSYVIDEAVVGPLGLVDLLETSLGLNGPGISAALRIAQYWARLRAIGGSGRFFSASLAADGWATARLLLSWRDELVAAGWSPDATSWQSDRLCAIAEAERCDEILLGPGLPDRVQSLVRSPTSCSVDRLTLVDDPEQLPVIWRTLFEALAASGTAVERHETAPATSGNDLATVQALLSGGASGKVAGDGSFTVVRCDDELLAADVTGEWLGASTDANAGAIIVRQGDGTILDAACHRLGLPKPGGSPRSAFRGAMQVLPLAFETAWTPLDAGRLLELLVMRGSPIPYRAGRHFSDVLRDFPGSGGTRWESAWERAGEEAQEFLSGEDLDDKERARRVADTVGTWREWLEPERYARESGLPAAGAEAICRKVQRWALKYNAGTGDSIFMQTANAAAALADTISASGLDLIPKPQIDRMIDAVIAEGVARPGSGAEAAPWAGVDKPEQIWDRVPTVVWWGFADPGANHAVSPWAEAELSELYDAGTSLLPPERTIALRLEAQRRAILNATERVLLVMPAASAAEPIRTHPVWHEIATLKNIDRTFVDGRQSRATENLALGGRNWDLSPVEARTLPRPIRDWLVPAGMVTARETESATSLESLLGCPMKWVLQYSAHIRESALLDMADDNRLKGNVAHEVLARFLGNPVPNDDDEVRKSVAALLNQMLPEIGAPLLLPGRLGDREDLHRNTVEGAVALSRLLRESRLSVVASERQIDAVLDDKSSLGGVIDLELADDQGHPVIVDLKWSNSDRYRRQEIEEARPVQLATYARLLSAGGDSHFPPAAYFMIKQRRVLAVDADPFTKESRISGTDLEAVWSAILGVRARVLDAVVMGTVVAEGIAKDALNADDVASLDDPISVEPPCRFCPYGRLCGERPVS